MPHTTHVLGVAALSPGLADARRLPALGWDIDDAPAGGSDFPIAPPAARGTPPAASGDVTYFIWDGDNLLVETDGADSVWIL